MDQPVGLSFLGGFLIVAGAGIAVAVLARLLRATTALRLWVDATLGTLGGIVVIFLLPMNGFALGTLTGWPAAVALGAAVPVGALHLVWRWGTGRRR